MGVLTWMPRQMRDQLEAIDPAVDIDITSRVSADQLITAAEENIVIGDAIIGEMPSDARRRRQLAPLVAAALVAAVAVAITLSPAGRGGDPLPAGPPFPVNANPRPVVLVGESVDAPDFSYTQAKIAFLDGDIVLATTLPAAPADRDGYPVMPAADAVHQISDETYVTTSTSLRIDSLSLTNHPFGTDRGLVSLPAWHIGFADLPDSVFVLAVAASARYPHRLDAGNDQGGIAGLSHDGRQLTIPYFGRHRSTGPCDDGYRTTLSVTQTNTAVRIVTKTVSDPPAWSGPPCVTPYMTHPPPRRLVPGTPYTKTITLTAPLGNRLVINGGDHPYVVTNN